MDTLLSAFPILVIVLLWGALFYFFFIRNHNVCKFRCALNEIGYALTVSQVNSDKHSEYLNVWLSLLTDVSYNKMLYSFKPLKPEYWYTPEQINFLKLSPEFNNL
jgi:hypothetical protein